MIHILLFNRSGPSQVTPRDAFVPPIIVPAAPGEIYIEEYLLVYLFYTLIPSYRNIYILLNGYTVKVPGPGGYQSLLQQRHSVLTKLNINDIPMHSIDAR